MVQLPVLSRHITILHFVNPLFVSQVDRGVDSPVTQIVGTASSGDHFLVGTTNLGFRSTDPAGNSVECHFAIVVNGSKNPLCKHLALYPPLRWSIWTNRNVRCAC